MMQHLNNGNLEKKQAIHLKIGKVINKQELSVFLFSITVLRALKLGEEVLIIPPHIKFFFEVSNEYSSREILPLFL